MDNPSVYSKLLDLAANYQEGSDRSVPKLLSCSNCNI